MKTKYGDAAVWLSRTLVSRILLVGVLLLVGETGELQVVSHT